MAHPLIFGTLFAMTGIGLVACKQETPPLEAALPEGWMRPKLAEFAGSPDMQFRTGNDYLSARGDFNGDGRSDEALLALNRDKAVYGVFVVFSSGEPIQLFERPINEASKIGIAVVRPGIYDTACGKGYDIGTNCMLSIELKQDGVSVVVFESSEQYFYWDGQNFISEWISA